MRRISALLLVLGLVAGLALPATAGGKKKITDSFGASLLPFPNYSSNTATARPGCSAGVENVHWVGQEFTAPASGTLRLFTEGFTGDHDVYVFEGDLALGRGDQEQVPGGAPPEEEVVLPLKPKQTVLMVACNWAGSPEVQATYEFVFKK